MTRFRQSTWPGWLLATALGLLRGVRIHSPAIVLGWRTRFEFASGLIVSRGRAIHANPGGRTSLDEAIWLARNIEVEAESHVSVGTRTIVQHRLVFFKSFEFLPTRQLSQ